MKALTFIATALLTTNVSATIIETSTILDTMSKASLTHFKSFMGNVKMDKDVSTSWKSGKEVYEVAVFGQQDVDGMTCKNLVIALKSAYSESFYCDNNGKKLIINQ